MLNSHVNKYMVHINNIDTIIDKIAYAEYYCFDTETCCTSEAVYNYYYNLKEKCPIQGKHAKVYAWALSNTSNDFVIYGENLNQFLLCIDKIFKNRLGEGGEVTKKKYNTLKKHCKINIGVHNLKFDIEFLKYTLFENNFNYYNSVVEGNKVVGTNIDNKCFNVVENDGIVYGANIKLEPIEIYYITRKEGKCDFKLVPHVEFFDTFKIMAQPLDNIGKKVIKIDPMFLKQGDSYDYDSVRLDNHILTQTELNYLYNDVYILKEFLIQFYLPIGTNCKTASSISFSEFLKYTWEGNSNKIFEKVFPSIYDDANLVNAVKKSYKGGWTFADYHYRGKHVKNINGTSIDINSSYPSQMYNKPLPYGLPVYYKGYKPQGNNKLNLLCIEFDSFYNKFENDYFGFLQANETNMILYGYSSTDYVYTNIIDGEKVGYSIDAKFKRFRKYIWQFELEDILQHTILEDLIIVETFQFKAKIGIFSKAIEHFMQLKIEGKKTNNNALTQFAKLCLNSFYGKMASSVDRTERKIIFQNNMVHFENTNILYTTDKKYYPPFASAVTAWGRCTLRGAIYTVCIDKKGFSPNVLYCDTDSVYTTLPLEELKKRMGDKLHPTELGKWDIEKTFSEFKAIGSKKYMVTEHTGKITCKCAGLTKESRDNVSYNDFYLGASFEGKLASKKVSGGILIIPCEFKLKITNFNL